jgi:hypothetical protein
MNGPDGIPLDGFKRLNVLITQGDSTTWRLSIDFDSTLDLRGKRAVFRVGHTILGKSC